jgi:glycosyltransferase involved in cell wall biosynthesis
MYEGKTISIIIPAHNEEPTIAGVVSDFLGHKSVDEVLVVANDCSDRTAPEATAAGARVVTEMQRGYGCALRRGMAEAVGDVFVWVEADGSFKAFDLAKFLDYLAEDTVVVGTRTPAQMVQQGANMRLILRWGNVVVAKLVELMWYISCEPRLTDLGCTYRALSRETWERIGGGLNEPGPAFSPEMMCEVLRRRMRLIEIPIHYFARTAGTSKHSSSYFKIAKTALQFLRAVVRKRFERPPEPAPAHESTR